VSVSISRIEKGSNNMTPIEPIDPLPESALELVAGGGVEYIDNGYSCSPVTSNTIMAPMTVLGLRG
jgi:hypothetical protein